MMMKKKSIQFKNENQRMSIKKKRKDENRIQFNQIRSNKNMIIIKCIAKWKNRRLTHHNQIWFSAPACLQCLLLLLLIAYKHTKQVNFEWMNSKFSSTTKTKTKQNKTGKKIQIQIFFFLSFFQNLTYIICHK